MTEIEIPYCTRRAVQRELGYADSVRLNKRIDEKILQASRDVEALCHRRFYPWTGTRLFDVPETDTLFLGENELAEVDAITSGASAMTADDYVLRPSSGPPYTRLDVRWSGSVGWESDQTWQEAIAITGTYHYPVRQEAGPDLAGSITDSATTLQASTSEYASAGSLLLIEDERLLVTGERSVDTGVALTAALAANKGQSTVTVDDGDAIELGEQIIIDGETMFVEHILGDTLIVTRGQNGSVLAAHEIGAQVWAPRSLTVTRGILGSTPAAHAGDTQIYLLRAPSLVEELTMAYAITALEQGSSGYGRVVGSADNQREAAGRGVQALADRVYAAYGRKARGRAI